MTKNEFEYPNNIVKMAAAMGTEEREKIGLTDQEIRDHLITGVSRIQAQMIMLEAAKLVMAGNKRLTKRVNREFRRIAKDLGLEGLVENFNG